eukprot:306677-Chlamydomonas_euryale.AAC.1
MHVHASGCFIQPPQSKCLNLPQAKEGSATWGPQERGQPALPARKPTLGNRYTFKCDSLSSTHSHTLEPPHLKLQLSVLHKRPHSGAATPQTATPCLPCPPRSEACCWGY